MTHFIANRRTTADTTRMKKIQRESPEIQRESSAMVMDYANIKRQVKERFTIKMLFVK